MDSKDLIKIISLGLSIFYAAWITIKMLNKNTVFKAEVIAFSIYVTTFIVFQFNLI